MNRHPTPLPRRAAGWLLGLALLLTGALSAAQQDPPGRVGRLNFQQGTVSFSPAGDDNWYQADPNRPLTTGDRLWVDRNARAEVYLGSNAVRLDEQTSITLAELNDSTARITATQGNLQVRVRDDPLSGRFEVDTANMAMVVNTPGDFRIDVDPVAGTTQVAVASGNVTLFGENGESMPLGAHQQLTVFGRNLAEATGAPVRAATDFDRWVAERDRLDDQSIAARYVPRDMVGYQQLDAYGDWQNDPSYGAVWYPRDVDAGWAPYQNGQWVEVAPWGWTWVDAAPWGFAPTHYGRWARIGPRWCWVPGRPHARPVFAPALVAFVGGTAAGLNANLVIGSGRHGVGWFPLAPGEPWRPDYRASQRYVDEVNRAAFDRRTGAAHNADFANRHAPGAVTVVPVDAFGHGPIGRRDIVHVPTDRLANVPAAMAAPIPLRGRPEPGTFGRPAAMPPPSALQARQQQQLPPAIQMQQAQRQQQQQSQQRAAGQAMQAQQAQQLQQAQRQQQEAQQRAAAQAMQQQQGQQRMEAQRQQQEMQQRGAAQAVQQQQAQQRMEAQRQQQETQQRGAAQAAQQQQAQQRMEAQRQQQEAQQRAAAQAAQQQQGQQRMEAQRQQQEAQQRAAAQAAQAQQMQQAAQRQQMEMQQRAAQAQAMQQQQAMRAQQQQAQQLQAQQQQAARQAQEARQRGPGRPEPSQQPGTADRP